MKAQDAARSANRTIQNNFLDSVKQEAMNILLHGATESVELSDKVQTLFDTVALPRKILNVIISVALPHELFNVFIKSQFVSYKSSFQGFFLLAAHNY